MGSSLKEVVDLTEDSGEESPEDASVTVKRLSDAPSRVLLDESRSSTEDSVSTDSDNFTTAVKSKSSSSTSNIIQHGARTRKPRKNSFKMCDNCERRKAELKRAKRKRRLEEEEQERIRQEYERDREMEPGCVGVTDNGRITILDPSYPGREGSEQWEEPRPGDTVFDYLQTINAVFGKRQRRN